MAKNNHAINSFVAGEVSPRFLGRYDTQQYAQGCEDTLNWLIFPQGGGARRPGTMHVERVRQSFYNFDQSPTDPADADEFTTARLVRFIASDGRRFQVVIKNHMPIYTGIGAAVISSWYVLDIETGEALAIYPFNPIGTFGASTAPMEDEYETVMPDVDLREIQVTQIGNRLYFAHTKFRTFYIQYNKSYFASSYFHLSMLGRTEAISGADNNYSVIAQMPFQAPYFAPSAGPYKSMKLITPSGTWTASTTGTLTTNSLGHISEISFNPGWVGRTIKFSKGGATTVWRVTGYTDTFEVTVTFMGGAQLGASSNIYGYDTGSNYELSYWGGDYGWATAVTGFETRLFLGGCTGFPDTYWASQANNVDRIMVRKLEQDPTFANPTVATDPFDATLRSETVSQIRWLASGKNITCGTNEREYIIQGPNSSLTIGPTNIQSNAETPHGSAPVQPVRVENTTVFLQRHRRSLRELVYSLDEASFKASDLNIVAEHIGNKSAIRQIDTFASEESYIVQLAIQQAPLGVIWAIDNNGALMGLTREREQNVLAWHYHELGGLSTRVINPDTPESSLERPFNPRVHSISTIQTPVSSDTKAEPDELWLIVERGVRTLVDTFPTDKYANVGTLFIERMAPLWRKVNIAEGWDYTSFRKVAPVYMDQTIVMDSMDVPEDFIITNLPHAPGTKVSVNCGGFDLGEFTVMDDFSINLAGKIDDYISTLNGVMIGYNYDAYVVPLVPEVPAQLGTAFGNLRRVEDVTVNFVRTIYAEVGCVPNKYEENTPIFNKEIVVFPLPKGGKPRQMVSTQKTIDYPNGYELKPSLLVSAPRPLPCEITDIVVKLIAVEA